MKKKSHSFQTDIYDLLGNSSLNNTIISMIEQKCTDFNLSQRQLSQILGLERKSLRRILEGEAKKIDMLTFLKISHFLGEDIKNLVKLYVSELSVGAIKDLESARKATFIINNFDLEALKKEGFIKSITNFEEIEQRICKFFSFDSLFDYQDEVNIPVFSQAHIRYDDMMRNLWIKSAYHQFKFINNPNPFSVDNLKYIIPKIRAYTRYIEKGLVTVARALYNIGVTVIVQRYLSKTQVHGATFIINDKPCIVLTDRGKRYDRLWFTLYHELAHSIYDFDTIKNSKYHLSGETDLFILEEDERNADFFAKTNLFSDEKINYIKSFIDTPSFVNDYANRYNIHKSIIYGFYLNSQTKSKQKKLYPKYSKFLISSEKAVKAIQSYPWDKESLKVETEKINTVFTS